MIQLRAIALYQRNGERREVWFRPGELNIITGEAKTGKSALLEIVDFCLGRETVTVPEGALTQTIDWYGLLVQGRSESAFIARPGPSDGQRRVSSAYLALGADLGVPDREHLEANANADAVTEYLTRLSGIGEYEHVPPAEATRALLRPTISHALFYCLQRQNEIANAQQLFHRQDEPFIPQAIKDTLPYFLGAADREAPTSRDRLTVLRRELRKAERELANARQLRLRAPERSAALLAEAVDLGLIPQVADEEAADVQQLLEQGLQAELEPTPDEEAVPDEYRRLTQQSKELTTELRAIAERAELLRGVESDQEDYGSELSEQAARLETLGLLTRSAETQGGPEDSDHCPVCGSTIEESDITVTQLAEAAAEVRVELEAVEGAAPARRQALLELEERAGELRQRLREAHEGVAALSRDRERLLEFRERAMARAYVKGKIAQHLTEIARLDDRPVAELEANVRRLTDEIDQLESRLDPDRERQQVISRLNVIGDDMTAWADQLELEHAEGRARIDAAQLTVVVDTAEGPIPLARMGSAGNWVGYHLVSHLALHKWFVEHARPVPGFLMLDQPTQAFYPPEVTDVATQDFTDADRRAVEAMFALIHEVVRSLAPRFQVIVTDHANLPEQWFQEAIVEEWRGGRKLVPAEWLEPS